ncbi:CRISPR-associated helicase/endonuclease Cas3 [Scatolibacter rhodanostii]|uniref:CRISPR-associated helicase/endonuclease Cas3 n=1 Tax=Scatolibacter rhodanostii TaxID=2014781 RepID=UPI000C08C9E2|nr:CRISPR-associated helicase/endonuclease Cas3 [Scatolibacter rhodanostii]
MQYLAHISEDGQREQSVLNHLTATAEKASQFAKAFSAADLGYLCGILHDIGKYSLKFQRRITGSNERVDHSTAGAQVACLELRNVPVGFCIAGHHGGLPNGGNPKLATSDEPTFAGKMLRKVGEDIEDYRVYQNELAVSACEIPKRFLANAQTGFFFTRMLYSCLVDADYLDTEAFMEDNPQKRLEGTGLKKLDMQLDDFIAPWWKSDKLLNQKRCEILKALIEGSGQKAGLFSLTVPTGGGKTVSSMAFALKHALENGLRRVIYVIPYTSIIEQTQKVFEKIFGEENVVAHYASLDYTTDESGKITDKRYLATENWDAPIIITTSVQFFESLYANRPSRCRKLHNIAESVIIFDEAQMLPVPYLKPCIHAVAELIKNYGCSAIMCTATQPALTPLFAELLPEFESRELCPNVSDMYLFFKRVEYKKAGPLSDEEVAYRLNEQKQVLCIVNNKRQAQKIYGLLDGKGCFHLSTMMCPMHRREVLDEIRDRLKLGKPCRVISTSLVEAGVDVDFPVVYRALAGLDSIIQAGGRCNREGAPEKGLVYIFESEQKPPQEILQNVAAAQRIMRDYEDISSPEAIQAYFDFLYYRLKDEKDLDKKEILREIQKGTMPFETVANEFQFIEQASCTVYVPWKEGESLINLLKNGMMSRGLLRKAGQYAVSVYQPHFNELIRSGAIQKIGIDSAVLSDILLYKEETGLSFEVNFGQEHIV